METKLLPCPFCGGEAEVYSYEAERDIFDSRSLGYVDTEYYDMWGCWCKACAAMIPEKRTEAEAIEAWNTRAPYETKNWFYLPKPKEPIANVSNMEPCWDGEKYTATVGYNIVDSAVKKWEKDLSQHIIERVCEVFKPERTCQNAQMYWCYFECSECGVEVEGGDYYGHNSSAGAFNFCPNCGAKVVD